jgi:hypothetical protein
MHPFKEIPPRTPYDLTQSRPQHSLSITKPLFLCPSYIIHPLPPPSGLCKAESPMTKMSCKTHTTFYNTCTHIKVLVAHDLACPTLAPSSPSSPPQQCPLPSSTAFIINSECPWCMGEMSIPHRVETGLPSLPVLEEWQKEERRRVYKAVVRRQMIEGEEREHSVQPVRFG